jgi:hypothetical protein
MMAREPAGQRDRRRAETNPVEEATMVMRKETSELKSTALALCALVCGLAAGCSSGGSANIGDGELSIDKSQLDAYAAAWDGYVEAYTFPSNTDRVRVTLDEQGNGWLQVGDGDELAPPTDPDVAWPEAAIDEASGKPTMVGSNLLEGIRYPITGAVVEEERIRLSIDAYDAFEPWCALQTPVLHTNETPAGYGCSLNAGYGMSDGSCTVQTAEGEPIPIDCGKAVMCASDACACDATACTAGDGRSIPFDAALSDDGQSLEGSIVLPDVDGARIVRLERQ